MRRERIVQSEDEARLEAKTKGKTPGQITALIRKRRRLTKAAQEDYDRRPPGPAYRQK